MHDTTSLNDWRNRLFNRSRVLQMEAQIAGKSFNIETLHQPKYLPKFKINAYFFDKIHINQRRISLRMGFYN